MLYPKNCLLKFFVFFFLKMSVSAQLLGNIEIEVVGNPSWQMLIPHGSNGMVLIVKIDQTKAKVFYFDSDLNKKWETNLYLDVERQPISYTFTENSITFLFRETKGLYYQFFEFYLENGNYINRGFELRDYFQDQNYVYFNKKLIISGNNQKGAALYLYSFENEAGSLIELPIQGQVSCQHFSFKNGFISSSWAVKTIAYSNAKRKKGQYVKDTFLMLAEIDTLGHLSNQRKITQKSGNFPISGKLIETESNEITVAGLYKNPSGDKGLFLTKTSNDNEFDKITFTSFKTLFPEFSGQKDFLKIIDSYNFLMHTPIKGLTQTNIGGVFYRREYDKVKPKRENNKLPYIPIMGGGVAVDKNNYFYAYKFTKGIIATYSSLGSLEDYHQVDINQLSNDLIETMSFNNLGSIAFCINGALAAKNFKIGNKPIVYKLSEDNLSPNNASYLPNYKEVRHWYDNYFIADGSKIKVEAVNIGPVIKPVKNSKKKKQLNVFTQIRKTIYLTKISSGS